MTTIKVKGQTKYGYAEVSVIGDKYVDSIDCKDLFIADYIKKGIENADGHMANGYHPEKNTMIQAFAFLTMIFPYSNVIVDGHLETIPYEPGVIF